MKLGHRLSGKLNVYEANEALVSTNSSHKSFEKEFKYTCYNDIQDKSKMPNKKHSGGNKNCFKMRRRVFRLSMIFGIVLYCQLPYSTFCLRDLLLSLPPAVSLRDTIGLNCTYHLQGEELYTINLYKGRHEFLQYMPERVPPLKQFHRKGINIQNITLEGTGKLVTGISVILGDVTLFTSGLYSCEASANPSFHTELVRKRMTVLVKPKDRPQVFGFKPRYRVGDTLGMTCYVNNTFPAANLTWFINGKRIEKHSVAKHEVITDKETRLQTSKSVLTLPLKPKHFRQRTSVNDKVSGQLRAKCLASMLTMHWQSEDIVITEESPTLASVVDSSDKKKNATIDTNKEDGGKESASSSGTSSKTSFATRNGISLSPTITSSSKNLIIVMTIILGIIKLKGPLM